MSAAAAVVAFVCMLAEAVQWGNLEPGVDRSLVARPGIYPYARSRLPADISNNNRRPLNDVWSMRRNETR